MWERKQKRNKIKKIKWMHNETNVKRTKCHYNSTSNKYVN